MIYTTEKRKPFVIAPQQVYTLGGGSQVYAAYCAACRTAVELVTLREASQISGMRLEELVERAADGTIHLGIIPSALLICLDSLLLIKK